MISQNFLRDLIAEGSEIILATYHFANSWNVLGLLRGHMVVLLSSHPVIPQFFLLLVGSVSHLETKAEEDTVLDRLNVACAPEPPFRR